MADENQDYIEANEADESGSDEAILQTARDRFKICQEAYADIHKQGRLDDEFSAGEQWPEEIKRAREAEQRPCLTINRLSQFIRQVVNDQKQNNPTATYSPEDSEADIETAKVYQGINRHIEKSSNADGARDWAFDGSARRGFGYWRLITDYVSPTSFLQEIKYQKIFDAYSVYLDPNHVEVDGSDATYGFIFSRLQKDEFCAKYKTAKLADGSKWEEAGKLLSDDWVSEDSCLVVEYYFKDFKPETLLLLSNGESVLESEFKKLSEVGGVPEEITVTDKRETVTEIVRWVKFAGDEILKKTEWGSRWIPIIPSYGEVQLVNGKKVLKSVIRDSHDSQRMLNYFITAEAEAIALTPKAPFVGAAGQFDGFEDKWATANSRPHAYLEYNQKDIEGDPAPPPARVVAEAQVQAITNARMQASEDLKSTTGIQDAALGAKSNENSGVAIQRRANQAQTSNYHFMANFEQSAKHSGRIIAELIPVVYDTPRAAKIIAEDGESEIIQINKEFDHKGVKRTYDLSKGKYDLSIDMGPGYQTQRQEALASMLELAKMNPQLMTIAGDLIAKNMDWPGSQEFVERIRKGMDPKLFDDGNAEIPPQAQMQLAQMGQMIEQLTQTVNHQSEVLKTKKMELDSRKELEAMRLETQLLIEKMKISTADARFQAELYQQMQELNAIQHTPGTPEMNQDFNESGSDQAATYEQEPEQQPTGGLPGPYME